MAKRKKALVETSAVLVSLGRSTANHKAAFQKETAGTDFYSSAYVRMESIRRWVHDYIRVAIIINGYGSVDEALDHLQQDFGVRATKATIAGIVDLLRRTGTLGNNALAAEEMARVAVYWLHDFDRKFRSRIPNRCRCRKGDAVLTVDFDTLLTDLHAFYEDFKQPVTDCYVNDFLATKAKRRDLESIRGDAKSSKTTAVQNFDKLESKSKHITCKECAQIGDLVIALEQPPKTAIAHIDKAFVSLCGALKKNSVPIISQRAAEKHRGLP